MLTAAQVAALEKAKLHKECVAQDTFYVGTLKGLGRVYQQTAIDIYSKEAFAKLYDRKTSPRAPISSLAVRRSAGTRLHRTQLHRVRLPRTR